MKITCSLGGVLIRDAGVTAHELDIQAHVARFFGAAALNAFDQEIDRLAAGVILRLRHGGQRRLTVGGQDDVIHPGNADVSRDLVAQFAQGAHGANRHGIVGWKRWH